MYTVHAKNPSCKKLYGRLLHGYKNCEIKDDDHKNFKVYKF